MTELWSHQRRAVDFAMSRRGGAMLALSMGVGKTRCAIEIARLRSARIVLVLCPLSVVDVWPHQLLTHAPGEYQSAPLSSGTVRAKMEQARQAIAQAEARRERLFIVLNYESAWREPLRSFLLRRPWDLVILDESHRIKAAGGKASRFCAELRKVSAYRLALTGTPTPHSPLDLYAQFRAVDTSVFGTSVQRFRNRYTITGGYGNHEIVEWINTDEMRAKYRAASIEISKEEALDLPEQVHVHRTCAIGPKARKLYDDLARDFWAKVEAGEITVANALVKLLRLQQITSGHLVTDDGQEVEVDTAKRDLLCDILADLPQRERVVVFCRFRRDLAAVAAVAEATGRVYGEVSGRRKDLVDGKFPPGVSLLGVQIQSGGLGIDLTAASTAVYMSMGFSLGDYEQSLSRLHRPGQIRKVTYFHLLAKDTVDSAVYGALQNRREVIQEVLGHGKDAHAEPEKVRRARKAAA